MKFVKSEFNSIIEIKKSKFIAYLCPHQEFNYVMERLKIEHPKARHFVYAYRFLNDFDQIIENSSDDGEPKGTSGRPTLKVLNGAEIINSAVIVVRYFGGTMLGTGGLVKAYSDAVNLVINEAEFINYEKLEQITIESSYTDLSKTEYLLNQIGIIINNKEFGDSVKLSLEATREKLSELSQSLDS